MLFDVTLASALQSKWGSETLHELASLWQRRRSGWGARNRAHPGVPGKLWGRLGAGNTARPQLQGALLREPRDPRHSWSARPTVASGAGSETPSPLWCGVAPASELGSTRGNVVPLSQDVLLQQHRPGTCARCTAALVDPDRPHGAG